MGEFKGSVADEFLEKSISEFRKYKSLAERAMEQLGDEDFYFHLDNDTNSVYVVVKHMAGNMRSRWTDFLTTDGEKPDRERDGEFIEDEGLGKQEIFAMWERGWEYTFDALENLSGDDLLKTVYIRREEHTVVQAILRQVGHFAYHVGQIVTLAKHIKGDDWEYMSIPRGQSRQFNLKHGM